MKDFEQLVTEKEKSIQLEKDLRRKELQEKERAAFLVLEPIYESVKDSLNARGFAIRLTLKTNQNSDTELLIFDRWNLNSCQISYDITDQKFRNRGTYFAHYMNKSLDTVEDVYQYIARICSSKSHI